MEALRQAEAFSHFTDKQVGQLERCSSRSRFPEGAVVLAEGDTSREAYLICKGEVKLQRQTSYGEFALAALEAEDLFGELSFIDGYPRSADAVAATDVELLVLNPVALSTLIERDQAFTVALYWAFWKALSKKLRTANARLTGFFSDASASPEAASTADDEPSGEFRIDVEAKRALFREQKLSNMEINFLASLSKAKRLEPEEILFREGDDGDRMYVVLEGRVMISKNIPGAGEEALAFLERGDFFGEMALIDREPRSADAKADTSGAVVLSIRREVLEKILDINKVSSIRLLKVLCSLVTQRLREVNEKIVGWYILAGGAPSQRA
jgi:CRP-like cAMP-binding protein